MIQALPAWLEQSVPLYAFLLALLTHPATWSRRATAIVRRRLDSGESTDSDPTTTTES
jgi:hypothetical protein